MFFETALGGGGIPIDILRMAIVTGTLNLQSDGEGEAIQPLDPACLITLGRDVTVKRRTPLLDTCITPSVQTL